MNKSEILSQTITKEILEELFVVKKWSAKKIADFFNCSKGYIYKRFKKFGFGLDSSQNCNLVGQKFGKLLVIKQAYIKNQQKFWECRCDCSNNEYIKIKFASSNNLKAGNIKSCGCLKQKYFSNDWISGSMWCGIIHNAKARGLEISIDEDYIRNIYKLQNGICVLSGRKITLPVSNKEFVKHEYTASLDRIDSTKGYIPGNVQWVHKDINMLKKNWGEKDLIEMCRDIFLQHLKKEATDQLV